MAIEKLISDLYNDKEQPQKPIPVNLSENMFLNQDLFKFKMDHLDEISDGELRTLVRQYYPTILNHLITRTDLSYIKPFENTRFLTVLCQVLAAQPFIDSSIITSCNKLAYDYLCCSKAEDSKKSQFIALANIVNRDSINLLAAKANLKHDLASLITLARFSTLDETVNIKRMNFIIMQQPANLMTVERIVEIYSALFSRIRDLFIYTFIDNCETWFTELEETTEDSSKNARKVYTNEADAVMRILNNTDVYIISQVIHDLLDLCSYKNLGSDNLRYSLRSMSQDVNNTLVWEIVKHIEEHECRYIY